ncbi:MAG: transporter substrate-binding domain-containing protein [Rhodospirillales bacterium]|jgi:lysine-arginine-ornithine-binding protein|nr:transporter substrate-binding domain-containing protein [Rhodospirillales bacterium]
MNFKKLALAAVVGIMALAGGQANAGDALRIGVEGAYPPFSWKEADGTLKGFDIDVAYALCEKMNRECTLVEQEWDGMIPALISRKFDAIVASMSITEDRKKRVDFSVKYYNTPSRMVAKDGAGFEVTQAGMAGKKIGVQRGTTHQCFVEKNFPDSEVVLYTSQEDVFADLASGRIDAQSSDALQAEEGFLNTDAGKGFAFIGGDQDDIPCLGEGAGIAVRKGDSIVTEFNNAIQAIRADGTYAKFNDMYFAMDIYGN